MISRSGIGCIITIIACLTGCSPEPSFDWPAGCRKMPDGEPIACTERKPPPAERCRPFFQDGTDRWIDCMSVGKK